MGLWLDVNLDVSMPPRWLWSFTMKPAASSPPGELAYECEIRNRWFSTPLLWAWLGWRLLKGIRPRWRREA